MDSPSTKDHDLPMSETPNPEPRPLTHDERLLVAVDEWPNRPRAWSDERAALFIEEARRDREYE